MLYMNITSTSGNVQRIITHVMASGVWYEQSRVWVNPGANLLLVADNLYGSTNIIRCFFELEPAFTGTSAAGFFTVYGFAMPVGADAGLPMTEYKRKIEIVGDSISAGYGAMGVGGGCPVMSWSSSNYATYDRMICDWFQANCSIVAWSGKGMYENCCDSGETMPSYYLQTRGGNAFVFDWDFGRFVRPSVTITLTCPCSWRKAT